MDAQSVKNTNTAKEKGYDAGKKVSGIKRHILVDSQGLLHAAEVTTADVTDRQGALLALQRAKPHLSAVSGLLADGGYTGKAFAQAAKGIFGKTLRVDIAKRSELHRFAVMPKRWIVERTFAWFNKCRRLAKNVERLLSTSRQFILLASLAITLKRS